MLVQMLLLLMLLQMQQAMLNNWANQFILLKGNWYFCIEMSVFFISVYKPKRLKLLKQRQFQPFKILYNARVCQIKFCFILFSKWMLKVFISKNVQTIKIVLQWLIHKNATFVVFWLYMILDEFLLFFRKSWKPQLFVMVH